MSDSGVPAETVLRLIDLAYAAAEPGGAWEPFLLALSDATRGRATVLLYHDYASAGSVGSGVRNDLEAVSQYNEHYCRIDPRALSPAASRLSKPGVAVPDQALISYADFEATEFFGFARRYEMSRCMTVALTKPGGQFSGLSITRSHDDAPFAAADLKLLEPIAPHAGRALRLCQHIDRVTDERASLLGILDRLKVGAVGIDQKGRVVFVNAAAAALARENDGFGVGQQGVFGATTGETRVLSDAVLQALTVSGGNSCDLFFPVRVRRPSGRPALQLLPILLSRSHLERRGDHGVRVILLVIDEGSNARLHPGALKTLFGLTPAEARFAAGLASGSSVRELEVSLGLTRSTARWMMEQVRSKTGARTQAQAVVRLLSSLARVSEFD